MYLLLTLKSIELIYNNTFKNLKGIQKNQDIFILIFSNDYLIQNYYNFSNVLENLCSNFYKDLNSCSFFRKYISNFVDIDYYFKNKDFFINLPVLTHHNLDNFIYILQNINNKEGELIKVGDNYSLDDFVNLLESFGYKRVGFISQYFEYNTRGNIIDLFPYLSDYPVRVEFEEDQIESIRYFDKKELLSIKRINSFILFRKNDITFNSLDLLDNLKDKIVLITDLSNEILKNRLYFALKEEIKLESSLVKEFINSLKVFYLNDFINENRFKVLPDLSLKYSILQDYMRKYFKGYKVLFLGQNIKDFIDKTEDIDLEIINTNGLVGGFVDSLEKVVFITQQDINTFISYDFPKKNLKKDFIFDIDRFEEGDLVVVDNLGIGIYLGIKTVEIKPGYLKDMALILFKNNKKVYLNIENTHIHRYIATKEISDKIKDKILSKPSVSEWNKKIKNLYLNTKEIADTILKINSKRLTTKAPIFLKTDLEDKVSKDFIYRETEDQKKAIYEVLKDLESNIPSNRLIIGDTGYGKTEVLIRAISRVIGNKYKVLFIVPSTVLAYQHYTTLYNRFNKYLPNSIKLYCSIEKSSNKNLKDFIENDDTLVLVSTNLDLDKLKDIFHKVGLVIIDEEHLLGLLFKEKVKEIFYSSHILMVSATPIPRTLFLSLNSLVDTTIISTPPSNYKPPRVFLMYFQNRSNAFELTFSIILKHLSNIDNSFSLKKNQIYYINNNIDELYLVYKYLLDNFEKMGIPIRMNILHSKLPKKLIEKVFLDFINRKYDLILSTTLMQSGLDNPNVDVMIIDNSHLLGLSQIYQLRGRVSRQGTQGYCYILFPEEYTNTKTFERISFFERENITNYDVVLRDLELRGPGTLLSTKQSGYINQIGVIQYLKLLSSYISNNNEITRLPEIESDLPMYLDESPYKNILYRKLILANTLEQFEEVKNQILDIYGKKLSENTQNLLFAIYNRIKYKGKAKKIIIKKINNNYKIETI